MRILRTATTLVLVAMLAALLATPVVYAATKSDSPYSPEYEQKIGQEAAAQVEKEYKRYEDEETLKRVNEIVSTIAPYTNRPNVKYDVRLLDTDIVNAFSLPGGIIYVTKGLLNEVQSDDELAGVLAHEMAHNCTYDSLRQADTNQELFTGTVAAAIAAVLLGADTDMLSSVFVAGEWVRRGVLGGYSIEMERAADRHAVQFLLETPYNPVGLLTFMDRLAARERASVDPPGGVFQSHPLSQERVHALSEQIYRAGLDINRRATTQWERPKAEVFEGEDGSYVRVVLWEQEIFRVLTACPEHDEPMQRAEAIVERLTRALEDGAKEWDVQLRERDGNPAVTVWGEAIVTIYPEDAQAAGVEAEQVAETVMDALSRAFRQEKLERWL